MSQVELVVDVTEAAHLDEPASVALTVHLPEFPDPSATTVVCFAKPGGGYSMGYYTETLPGPNSGAGSQAQWHANRGWDSSQSTILASAQVAPPTMGSGST